MRYFYNLVNPHNEPSLLKINKKIDRYCSPSLDVVDKAEVLVGLLQLDDVHEAGGELGVSPDLAVDLKLNKHL